MYVKSNFKSKAALKRAIANGEKVTVFQRNADITGVVVPSSGLVFIEGPHFPEPHRWYGEAYLEDGKVIKVK